MSKKINLQESWEEMAPYYQKKYGESLMFYEKTIHLPLLGDLKDKKLLDLGCGGGQTSIFFATQGAVVTGIDFSKRQTDFAEDAARKEKIKVEFLQVNIEDLSMFEDRSFDLVNSSHVIHYVKNIKKCFSGIFRVLKPWGKFVFSVSHPFNHIVETKNGSLIVKRSYFSRGKYIWNWEFPEEGVKYPIYLYMRRISDYFSFLRKSGFLIEDLIEPKTDLDKNSPWYDDFELEKEMVPGTIIFGSRKPKK